MNAPNVEASRKKKFVIAENAVMIFRWTIKPKDKKLSEKAVTLSIVFWLHPRPAPKLWRKPNESSLLKKPFVPGKMNSVLWRTFLGFSRKLTCYLSPDLFHNDGPLKIPSSLHAVAYMRQPKRGYKNGAWFDEILIKHLDWKSPSSPGRKVRQFSILCRLSTNIFSKWNRYYIDLFKIAVGNEDRHEF